MAWLSALVPARLLAQGTPNTALAPASSASTATTNQPSAAVQRSYAAPPECPSADEFWRAVDERGSKGKGSGLRMQVEISEQGGHYWGHLQLDDGVHHSERSVDGVSCPDTSNAMVLVVTLALDALALRTPPTPAASSRLPDTVSASGPRWGLEAEALVDSAPAPSWVYGGGLRGRLAARDRRSEIGLSLGYRAARPNVGEQSFRVDLTALRVEGCPVGLQVLDHVYLLPCAYAEGGAYRAVARGGFQRRESPVFEGWGAGGLALRLRWYLGEHWALTLAPALEISLRHGYELAIRDRPDGALVPLYTIPTFAAFGSAGFGYEFE